ncbi:MAG TPA: RlpA-like double-psi beta-barrel domain-containing protein [Candidatus Tectomicrobia bacterium]|nr:RlpA-like double-psi beta-barrel domain-containing protein [Candidatus Tectomicrobia bacterium]
MVTGPHASSHGRACHANATHDGGALRPLAHAHARRRLRRSREDHAGEDHTSRFGLLVWAASSGAHDGQRGARLAAAIDGGAPLLALGTKVKVTNLRTTQQVVVTINDRGPYAGGTRIIDLSEAAATRVGLLERGTERVEVAVVERAS